MITEQLGIMIRVPATNGNITDLHQLSFLEDTTALKMSSGTIKDMVATILTSMMIVKCSGSITISMERSLNLLVQERLDREVHSMIRLLVQVLPQLHYQLLNLRIKSKFLSIPYNLAIMQIPKINMKIDGNSKSKTSKIR